VLPSRESKSRKCLPDHSKESSLSLCKPDFANYRRVASKVFSTVPWNVDFDHALARAVARKAKPQPGYVLMLRVPPDVNHQHGFFEKRAQLPAVMPSVYFADDRIFDKWLGRPPLARQRSESVMAGYNPGNKTTFGLTQKQKGRWAYAIGRTDVDPPMDCLSEFTPQTIE
jgi:hypothetical protein